MKQWIPTLSEKEWSLLQVYHFQELSRTSIRDAIFERDGRYVQLKKDLQEEVNKLSPAQLLGSLFVTVVRGFSLEEDIDLKILWQNKTVCLNVFDVSCAFTWCVYDVLIWCWLFFFMLCVVARLVC